LRYFVQIDVGVMMRVYQGYTASGKNHSDQTDSVAQALEQRSDKHLQM